MSSCQNNYQLNAQNWDLVWTGNFEGEKTGNVQFPIPKITVPVTFDSHFIAIHASSPSNSKGWKFGGFANQRVLTGLTTGGTADALASFRKIYLDQINLIEFRDFTSTFTLEFSVPYWISDINYVVYKYTGTIT